MSLKIENKGATFSSLSSFNTGFLFERRKIHNLKLLKLLDGLSKGSLLIEDQIIGEYIHYAHLAKQLMILATKFEDSTVVNFASSFENAKYRQYVFLFIWIFHRV